MYTESLEHDPLACQTCVDKRTAIYSAKHPTWTAEQARKYARFKCKPCASRPQQLEPNWVHWAVIFFLIWGALVLTAQLARV